MIKYYCDRCKTEIDAEQYEITPPVYNFKKINTHFVVINGVCKLCYNCMKKYVSFLNGEDMKEVK